MRSILWLALSCFLVASAADAAPRKSKRPVRKGPVKAASRMPAKPPAPKLPTTAGIMVPKSVVLIRAIPAETRAHAVWTLRAALNVAALQCQYSPFLRSVDNYNQMLKKHGDWMELGSADEQKDAKDGTVEAWGRSTGNPVGGWYGLKKGLRGRFGMYVPPLMEALGLAEVEHNARGNRIRAI